MPPLAVWPVVAFPISAGLAKLCQGEVAACALIANGAGQWVRGHYVAASAFAFVPTLEYVLGS